jgi:RNA polymerase sigma factor (sigma-70 family)
MAIAREKLGNILVRLRQAALGACQAADHDLLQRFILQGDESAFTVLVKRYGPMVLGLCLRILRHRQDAEDVFQAVFLVLARKAGTIRQRESLAGWLHRVAYRTAMKLRAANARRHARTLPLFDVPEPGSGPDLTLWETQRVLEEELERLSDKYRAPLLLCCVQGRTRDEAARQLGWSLGVLRGRLDRGRELLRARLARRGLALSAVLLPLGIAAKSEAAVLPALLSPTIQAALHAAHVPVAAGVSAQAAALAQGVIQAMFLTKMKMLVTGLVVLAFLGTGAGVLTYRAQAQAPAQKQFVPSLPAAEPAQKKTPALGGGDLKEMNPAQMKREIERLRLELEQTRLLLKLANKEILELRAREAEAKEREKIRKGTGGSGGNKFETPPDGEAVRKARAEEEAARKALDDLRAKRLQAEIEASKAKEEAKKAQELQPGKVHLIVVSPDQKLMAAAEQKSISLVDAATRKEIRSFLGHSHPVTALAFSPDGKRLASGSKDKSVILWDLATGKIFSKTTLGNPVIGLDYSKDGRSLSVRQPGQTTEIDAATGKVLRVQKDAAK